jgi:endonuclease YncB( thermonuclease family)
MHRFLLITIAFLLSPAYAQQLSGLVVGISDGDTVTLLDSNHQQHRIRLSGIDAPESHQPFGQKSKASLSAMIFNRNVVAECGKTDRYRRYICKILVNNVDANLEQLKGGMAWWYRQYAKEQSPKDREDYEVAESTAKAQRLGIWSDKNPVPPWEWRRGR